MGIVLNFTDDDRVRDTSVLNPNWVTDGIYALLNNANLQKQSGYSPVPKCATCFPMTRIPANSAASCWT